MKKRIKKIVCVLFSCIMLIMAVGCSLTEGIVEAVDKELCLHENVEKVEYKAPTCIETGLTAGEVCKDCGAYINGAKVIAATGHNYVYTSGKSPTCTTDGYSTGTGCVNCLFGLDIIPATGHKESCYEEEPLNETYDQSISAREGFYYLTGDGEKIGIYIRNKICYYLEATFGGSLYIIRIDDMYSFKVDDELYSVVDYNYMKACKIYLKEDMILKGKSEQGNKFELKMESSISISAYNSSFNYYKLVCGG